MPKIYKGQIGLKLIVETNALDNGIDLTGATCELSVKKPNHSTIILPATIENGSQFVYTTDSESVLDLAGRYFLQAKVTKDGFSAFGETAVLTVNGNFN